MTVALPRGWASQGPWNCCLGGSGQSVQNNKPGTGAVVADFAVNQAAKIPPNHPAPTSATAALNAWSTALGNNVSGVIANFQPNRVVTRPLSGPAFDQFAGHTYTGTLHGSPIAGFIVVLWNSRTKHNVMGWLISSGQSKAVAAEGDLNQMVASIAASN